MYIEDGATRARAIKILQAMLSPIEGHGYARMLNVTFSLIQRYWLLVDQGVDQPQIDFRRDAVQRVRAIYQLAGAFPGSSIRADITTPLCREFCAQYVNRFDGWWLGE